MKWTEEASEAIAKVPFFVRKRVRKRVEEEATRLEAREVRIEHVRLCQKKFLSNMENEVKGYQVETCFGPTGCPNRALSDANIAQKLDSILEQRNLKNFLKERVKGPLKMHHEFRISIADCPNACSRPQIVDVGLIGACKPVVCDEPCSKCGSCVNSCREDAVALPDNADRPIIDTNRCLFCGQCIAACPTGTIKQTESGYRILVGGKLGRHPQLGKDLGRIFSADQTLAAVEKCLEHFMAHNRQGERFGEILNCTPLDDSCLGEQGADHSR